MTGFANTGQSASTGVLPEADIPQPIPKRTFGDDHPLLLSSHNQM
ncbi:hypothetical protein ACFOON_12540 [Novosphingobium piscinae]|nr:hypothetical protein [Novosphingobium piscinae]